MLVLNSSISWALDFSIHVLPQHVGKMCVFIVRMDDVWKWKSYVNFRFRVNELNDAWEKLFTTWWCCSCYCEEFAIERVFQFCFLIPWKGHCFQIVHSQDYGKKHFRFFFTFQLFRIFLRVLWKYCLKLYGGHNRRFP